MKGHPMCVRRRQGNPLLRKEYTLGELSNEKARPENRPVLRITKV